MADRTEVIVVDQSLPSARLDQFLRTRYPAVSRGTIQRLIESGDILVGGTKVKPTHHPRAGEEIRVHWPEPRSAVALPEDILLEVLFEDDDLLVINKPAGLVVHPSAGHEEHTLVNALLHHCAGKLSGIGGVARPGIVHRLDKDTSGCLIVAKNDRTHLSLSEQFAGREVQKTYHALLCGVPGRAAGEIRAAIARHPTHRKRMAATDGDGREAWTSYRVIEKLGEACLAEAELHTGRTHQIRVHFQYLGYPIVGDDVYGARQNQRLSALIGLKAPRQMLHASVLSLVHPAEKRRMRFEAALPEDFETTRDLLRNAGSGKS